MILMHIFFPYTQQQDLQLCLQNINVLFLFFSIPTVATIVLSFSFHGSHTTAKMAF